MIYYTPDSEKLIDKVSHTDMSNVIFWDSVGHVIVSMTSKEAKDFYDGRRTIIPLRYWFKVNGYIKCTSCLVYEKAPINLITGMVFLNCDSEIKSAISYAYYNVFDSDGVKLGTEELTHGLDDIEKIVGKSYCDAKGFELARRKNYFGLPVVATARFDNQYRLSDMCNNIYHKGRNKALVLLTFNDYKDDRNILRNEVHDLVEEFNKEVDRIKGNDILYS